MCNIWDIENTQDRNMNDITGEERKPCFVEKRVCSEVYQPPKGYWYILGLDAQKVYLKYRCE